MTKHLYIETVGCQMNVLDSELVVAALRDQGYDLTDDVKQADTILFNTCSVRQRAEDKVYSSLGRLRQLKRRFPAKVIGVIGCMAQKDQSSIFSRAPYVDLIVGPGQLHQIPDLIERVQRGEGRQMEVSLGRKDGSTEDIIRSHESYDPLRDPSMRPTPWQAYVRIQIGCDKFCTYCIVPRWCVAPNKVDLPSELSWRSPPAAGRPRAHSRSLCSDKRSTAIVIGRAIARQRLGRSAVRLARHRGDRSASSLSPTIPRT